MPHAWWIVVCVCLCACVCVCVRACMCLRVCSVLWQTQQTDITKWLQTFNCTLAVYFPAVMDWSEAFVGAVAARVRDDLSAHVSRASGAVAVHLVLQKLLKSFGDFAMPFNVSSASAHCCTSSDAIRFMQLFFSERDVPPDYATIVHNPLDLLQIDVRRYWSRSRCLT